MQYIGHYVISLTMVLQQPQQQQQLKEFEPHQMARNQLRVQSHGQKNTHTPHAHTYTYKNVCNPTQTETYLEITRFRPFLPSLLLKEGSSNLRYAVANDSLDASHKNPVCGSSESAGSATVSSGPPLFTAITGS
eukprot:m.198285 g.198285  ORF g.198285 m.198285 type:complete len:134 (-) comp14920_c0_seq3:1334-1735(-)